MGKKRRILLAASLVVLLGGLAWWLLRPREPSYQGKSLSVWLEDYRLITEENYGSGYRYSPQTIEALRNMGTNAIPTLLRILWMKDSPLKARLMGFLDRHAWMKIKLSPASDKNFAACEAFRVLGVEARTAVPELVRDFETNPSADSQSADAYALGCIGPAAADAIPSLLRGLTSTNLPVRVDTAVALGHIHGKPEAVVPQLGRLLHDSNPVVRWCAAYALQDFGTNAISATPDLIAMLSDTRQANREIATNALKQIDPETAAKASVK
jgi:hypothetical protein